MGVDRHEAQRRGYGGQGYAVKHWQNEVGEWKSTKVWGSGRRRGGGPITFKVELTPTAQRLMDLLDGVRAEAVDWSPLWPRLVDVVIEGTARNVADRGAALKANGITYAQGRLAWRMDPRYLRRKAMWGLGVRDLWVRGELLNRVLTHRGVLSQTPKALTFGVRDLPYGPAMNFVRRPFLGRTKWIDAELSTHMTAFLEQVVRRNDHV